MLRLAAVLFLGLACASECGARYIESDPIGLRGGSNTYTYVGAQPLRLMDAFGLKSRVCCRQLDDSIARYSSVYDPRHCYVETDNAGGHHTFGLMGGPLSEGYAFGVGQTLMDNIGFDFGGNCREWTDECTTDKCVKDTATSYPNPSEYGITKSNSNTYAGTISRKCGLKRPIGSFS